MLICLYFAHFPHGGGCLFCYSDRMLGHENMLPPIVLERVQEIGLRENTIIFFLSFSTTGIYYYVPGFPLIVYDTVFGKHMDKTLETYYRKY